MATATLDLSPAETLLNLVCREPGDRSRQADIIPRTTDPVWIRCECASHPIEVVLHPCTVSAFGQGWRIWTGRCSHCRTLHWTAAPID